MVVTLMWLVSQEGRSPIPWSVVLLFVVSSRRSAVHVSTRCEDYGGDMLTLPVTRNLNPITLLPSTTGFASHWSGLRSYA